MLVRVFRCPSWHLVPTSRKRRAAGLAARATWLVGALLVLPPARAAAQDGSRSDSAQATDSLVQARETFLQGAALARQGQWRDALGMFERSAALHAHPVTTYNVAFCERALGHLARARERFAGALSAHEAGSGTLPEELVRSAKVYLTEADQRLARVRVTVRPDDVAISVDRRPLAPSAAGGDPAVLVAGTREIGPPERPPSTTFVLLADPGPHVFLLTRAGVADRVVEYSFDEGAATDLTLEARPPEPNATAPNRTRSAAAPKREGDGARSWTTPGYIVVAAGAASLTAAGLFGVVFAVNKSDLDDACIRDTCPSDRKDQIALTNGAGTGALIALGIGAASMATGIFLLAKGRDPRPSASGARRATVAHLALGGGGVHGSF
jgi:hypothetical protein